MKYDRTAHSKIHTQDVQDIMTEQQLVEFI